MTADKNPRVRTDLELLPIQQGNKQFILIRDHLGLVEEGKAVPLQLYELITLLDGTNTLRDLQMVLMRQRGGVLVGIEEVEALLAHLDESFLLDTERYQRAKNNIVVEFTERSTRPCSHCGRSYPAQPTDLANKLDDILRIQSPFAKPAGKPVALVAPHIDLSVGSRIYASAYQWLTHASPSRVVVLGVGHQIRDALFCLTKKDFETPLGVIETDRDSVEKLWGAGREVISPNDFAHKAEHSVEFQVIFLQHLFQGKSLRIIPILCGPLMTCLPAYNRVGYRQTAKTFLTTLAEILRDGSQETLLIAGVDFSHIGLKFGHDKPAAHLQAQTERHDQELLKALSQRETDAFWEESIRAQDQFNVCGFSAMACLSEVLPPAKGQVLGYEIWHEQPTRSAVSFAAVGFIAT